MPRSQRLINKGEKTAYHFMSRAALGGFPFGDVEKDELVKIIKKFSKFFFVDVFGYCVMCNHFHILAQVTPGQYFTDEEIRRRCKVHYGKDLILSDDKIVYYREKLSNPSNYMKEIKQSFSYYYNKRHNRRGTLWGERFKSVIVEKGETLINCLAYIDLNPLRAGVVELPEEYRWNSIGYHIQTKNKDDFLSFDFGLTNSGLGSQEDFDPAGTKSKDEKLRRYRKYLYGAGALDRPD